MAGLGQHRPVTSPIKVIDLIHQIMSPRKSAFGQNWSHGHALKKESRKISMEKNILGTTAMKTLEMNSDQKKLLLELRSVNVPFHYSLTTREISDTDSYTVHKQAALNCLKTMFVDGHTLSEVEINTALMHGERISLPQFIGNRYSIEKRRAALFAVGKGSFWVGDAETAENRVDFEKEFKDIYGGYSYAFFCPPYGLRGTAVEQQRLFHDAETLFFDRFDSDAMILSWSAECASNYFGAGEEWWGTYFYSYSLPDSDTVLAMAASETD